jgi:TBC1 domain family member 5
MRTLEASRQRWNVLVDGDRPRLDLWQAVRDVESNQNPCEDGLRSVCWKVSVEQ